MTAWKPLFIVACLLLPVAVRAIAPDVAPTLAAQADAAYRAGSFAQSSHLFDRALAANPGDVDLLYNASCAHALAGNNERALVLLDAAISAGKKNNYPLAADRDLVSLHADPRWPGLVARHEKNNPAAALRTVMMDREKQTATRYFTVRRAMEAGFVPPPLDTSPFLEFYANLATFVGQYDEAGQRYRAMPPGDPIGTGYSQAKPANAAILARIGDRRAVFLNESHARAETRAANFTLLAPLRKLGFNILALEGLWASRATSGSGECADSVPMDAGLATRGYPVASTGYYTAEPVYAQTLREALRLGYRVVGYDTDTTDGPEAREEGAARNLACLVKDDPQAKVLLVAGFGHIGENPASGVKGGSMAYRFTAKTGIDPLTIDTTLLGQLDVSSLDLEAVARTSAAEGFVLANAEGDIHGDALRGYDITLYVRPASHRNDGQASWLELGGARNRSHAPAVLCGDVRPCLVEAHPARESDEGIPADRCIIDANSPDSCTLFLAPGRHRITYSDEFQAVLSQSETTVR